MAKFLGGEPFLQRESLPGLGPHGRGRAGRPTCFVTTNGTQWNQRVEAVLDSLPISIVVSLDGFHRETYESVRQGADHAEVMANVDRFHAYTTRAGYLVATSRCA